MHYVLKDNSEEIREKIKASGIRVCICCEFEDSCWLDYSTVVHNKVHGVGYTDETCISNSQEDD